MKLCLARSRAIQLGMIEGVADVLKPALMV